MLLKDTLPFCDDDFVISAERKRLGETIPLSSVMEDPLRQIGFQFTNLALYH